MARQTLFHVLKDSPWWVSAVVGGAVFLVARHFVPDLMAVFAGLPFFVISVYAAWRQITTPSPARVAERMEALRAMSWDEFSPLMAEAFRRDGYDVEAVRFPGAEFRLRRDGRTAVASCRRWKAAQGGIGPLKELLDAMKKAGADDAVFVTAGGLSPNARDYAIDHAIQVLTGVELVQMLKRVK